MLASALGPGTRVASLASTSRPESDIGALPRKDFNWFVNYSGANVAVARAVHRRLLEWHFTVCFDDEDWVAGRSPDDETIFQVRRCEKLLALLGPAENFRNQQRELTRAQIDGIPIVPLLLPEPTDRIREAFGFVLADATFRAMPTDLDDKGQLTEDAEIALCAAVFGIGQPAAREKLVTLRSPEGSLAPLHGRALLIGVEHYVDSAFHRNAAAPEDILGLSVELRRVGWEVEVEVEYTGYQDIVDRVRQLSDAADPSEQLLVYFTGHGRPIEGGAAICPANADSIGENLYSISTLRKRLSRRPHAADNSVGATVVILDCCYSQPPSRLELGGDMAEGVAYFGASRGPTDASGSAATSPFTAAIIDQFKRGGSLTTGDLKAALDVNPEFRQSGPIDPNIRLILGPVTPSAPPPATVPTFHIECSDKWRLRGFDEKKSLLLEWASVRSGKVPEALDLLEIVDALYTACQHDDFPDSEFRRLRSYALRVLSAGFHSEAEKVASEMYAQLSLLPRESEVSNVEFDVEIDIGSADPRIRWLPWEQVVADVFATERREGAGVCRLRSPRRVVGTLIKKSVAAPAFSVAVICTYESGSNGDLLTQWTPEGDPRIGEAKWSKMYEVPDGRSIIVLQAPLALDDRVVKVRFADQTQDCGALAELLRELHPSCVLIETIAEVPNDHSTLATIAASVELAKDTGVPVVGMCYSNFLLGWWNEQREAGQNPPTFASCFITERSRFGACDERHDALAAYRSMTKRLGKLACRVPEPIIVEPRPPGGE